MKITFKNGTVFEISMDAIVMIGICMCIVTALLVIKDAPPNPILKARADAMVIQAKADAGEVQGLE